MTGHGHGDAMTRAGARHAGRLWWAFALVGTVFVLEAVAGIATGSLALLSDAGHMLTDVIGLGMALAAIQLANRAGTGGGRSFGLYRLEILAAFANAILLFGIAGYVLFEAISRIGDPPEIATGTVLVVATIGLGVNVVAWRLLRPGVAESLNVEGAYLEVLADLIGSVAVIVVGGDDRHDRWAVGGRPRRCRARGVDPAPGVASRPAGAPRPRSRRRPPGSTWLPSGPTSPAWTGSSTFTTSTCGRSPPRWTSPRRT